MGSKIKGTITLKDITIGSKYKNKYQTKVKYAVRSDVSGKFIFKNVPAGKWLLYVKYSSYVMSEQVVLKKGQDWYDTFKMGRYNPYLGW